MHTCIHAYMHTYVHTYVRTYVRTYIHTSIHQYINVIWTWVTRSHQKPFDDLSATRGTSVCPGPCDGVAVSWRSTVLGLHPFDVSVDVEVFEGFWRKIPTKWCPCSTKDIAHSLQRRTRSCLIYHVGSLALRSLSRKVRARALPHLMQSSNIVRDMISDPAWTFRTWLSKRFPAKLLHWQATVVAEDMDGLLPKIQAQLDAWDAYGGAPVFVCP